MLYIDILLFLIYFKLAKCGVTLIFGVILYWVKYSIYWAYTLCQTLIYVLEIYLWTQEVPILKNLNEFQVVSIPDSFLFTGFLDKIFQSQSHHKGLNSNKILSISVSASFPLYSPHLKESARFSKIYLGYMSWVGSILSYFHIFLSLSLDLSSPFPPSLPPFLPSFFCFFFLLTS